MTLVRRRFSAHLKAAKKESEMGRTLNQVIADLPQERQERIEARYQDLRDEADGLRELRQIAGKAQAEMASALNIKQPSVSKIEKQADMYLSTLRGYVEAMGGELELVVTLPTRGPLRLRNLGDMAAERPTGIQAGRRPGTRKPKGADSPPGLTKAGY
ncbi:MAG: XRE family transcriptional regulator [Methylovirgula sp.]